MQFFNIFIDIYIILILDEILKDKKFVKFGLGKVGFGRVMKAMKIFKRVIIVIRVTRRFRKGFLDIIFKIFQEEVMVKILDENYKKQEYEIKEFYRCISGRLVSQFKIMFNEENLEKKKSQLEMEQVKQRQEERICKFR